MTSSQIRQTFLDFFASKGHTIVPGAPVVIKNDPTLLFTNAGMNQFKDYFLGNKKAPFSRVADTQKCLRVSGKHNDLEEVGVDTYHHTLFEMLGNWSFGDPANPQAGYFKKEAIAWSWELLTEVYKLDKERLYVTIFEGDLKEGLTKDEEAYNEWIKWIPAERILLGNKKDNFWEMGDTGPCGPCTEIHFDSRPDATALGDGASKVNADDPQVIEIWNNVFIQFNRLKNGSLEPLPAKHVDTGMGFERLVRVIQGKTSNYDTDVFTGIIEETENLTHKKYDYSDSKQAIAFRVIADHIRAIAFTMADGQLPSNTGAGYVIRRILRRAVRYYYSYLDYKEPLLYKLLPFVAKQFEHVFPELYNQQDFVGKVIKEEEEAFLRTLHNGIWRFNEYIDFRNKYSDDMKVFNTSFYDEVPFVLNENGEKILDESKIKTHKPKTIPGRVAFELTDTYGFPLDLTALMAKEIGWQIDIKEFEEELSKQKSRSRAATALDTGDWVVLNPEPGDGFVGYRDLLVKTHVQKYRKVAGKGKEQYQLVLATTPFYAESGGQVGDTGKLTIGDEVITVVDTKKEGDLIVHFVNELPAHPELKVEAAVDNERRLNIMYNHTATHLMHAALRRVLGTHVAQKGSLVNNEGLRFDFSHFAKMTDEEIRSVEKMVNDKIRANLPVVIRTLPKAEALALGAMALFGEKYGDEVRVVTIDPDFSVELCGGTHVMSTGMIGVFMFTAETAVAAGVRRAEAITGPAAFRRLSASLVNLKEIGTLLKATDPIKAVERLMTENAQLKKRIEHLEARQLVVIRNEILQKDEIINQVNFIGDIVEVPNADSLKKLAMDLKNHLNDFVVVLCANIDGKPFVAISIADTVVAAKGLDAGKIIKELVAPLINGGGGGQKTLATAGGQDVSGLKEVIEKVKGLL